MTKEIFMNGKTAKLISPERVEQLLECYGADPKSWPDDERATASALILHSDHLKQLQKEAEHLDKLLVQADVAVLTDSSANLSDAANVALVERIIKNLPAQGKAARQSLRDSSNSTRKSVCSTSNWLSMAAASIAVIVVTFSIVELSSLHSHKPQNVHTQQELDNWMWTQIGNDVDNDEDEPLTVMSFLEM